MYEPLLFVAGGTGLAPDHQTESIKLIFHSAPTAVRQIYVDIPSINVERLMEYDVPGWSTKQLVGLLIQGLFLEDSRFFALI